MDQERYAYMQRAIAVMAAWAIEHEGLEGFPRRVVTEILQQDRDFGPLLSGFMILSGELLVRLEELGHPPEQTLREAARRHSPHG